MNIRKSRLFAIALAGVVCLPNVAFAQIVSDPATEAATAATQAAAQQTFLEEVKSYTTDGQILGANNAQIANQIKELEHQLEQIAEQKAMDTYTKTQLSKTMSSVGTPLVNEISQNNTLMDSQTKLDPQMTQEFATMVPNYKPGASYATYAQTLQTNTAQSEAQALGVGSAAVKSEADVNKALAALTNAPTNQLQALQEILQVGKIQSAQLDKLVKIQSAMMKNMAYEWAAHEKLAQNGGSSQLATSGNAANARMICTLQVMGFNQMSEAAKAPYMAACKQAAASQATVGTTTTP